MAGSSPPPDSWRSTHRALSSQTPEPLACATSTGVPSCPKCRGGKMAWLGNVAEGTAYVPAKMRDHGTSVNYIMLPGEERTGCRRRR